MTHAHKPTQTHTGMAYAVIANLPAIWGLYASTVAGFVYALFGGSGQLSMGAVVLVRLGVDLYMWFIYVGCSNQSINRTSHTPTPNPNTTPQVSLFMSEAYSNMGVPLVSKDKDPVLNHQAQYHTYVRCQMAAVVSLGAAVRCVAFYFMPGLHIKIIT